MKIYEQADKTGDRITFSWILDGVAKRAAKRLGPAWKWTRGPGRGRGVFVTNDPEAAAAAQHAHGCPLESNGTHAVHGCHGLLVVVS